MPVHLFTYHAYRSWMPDHPRGFVKKDEGYQSPNPKLNSAYRSAANFPPFEFDHNTQRFLIETSLEICARRKWRLHAAATERTHLHEVVSWDSGEPFEQVRGKIRNILSLELSKRASTFGRPWFVEGSSRRRVTRSDHFKHLTQKYLPDHSGWRWTEGREWSSPREITPAFRQGLTQANEDGHEFPDFDFTIE